MTEARRLPSINLASVSGYLRSSAANVVHRLQIETKIEVDSILEYKGTQAKLFEKLLTDRDIPFVKTEVKKIFFLCPNDEKELKQLLADASLKDQKIFVIINPDIHIRLNKHEFEKIIEVFLIDAKKLDQNNSVEDAKDMINTSLIFNSYKICSDFIEKEKQVVAAQEDYCLTILDYPFADSPAYEKKLEEKQKKLSALGIHFKNESLSSSDATTHSLRFR